MKIDELIETMLMIEGIDDKYIFKAMFTAGGAGSGKSFIARQMFAGMGMKFSNSDIPLEYLLKKRKLSFDIDPEKAVMYKKQMIARKKAKEIAGSREKMWINGMLGLVVDGTGKKFQKIKNQSEGLKAIGYDTGMIFVNTSLDVALERNRNRKRSVPENVAINSWKAVQSNMGKFQNYFGGKNFFIVDNNKMLSKAELQKLGIRLRRTALKWAGKPVQNPVGKKTIEILKATGGKTLADLETANALAASKYDNFVQNCLQEIV